MMIRTIVFDLSEVLISGLIGIEVPLAKRLGLPRGQVLEAFGGHPLIQLCRGQLSEDDYLTDILQVQQWDITVATLKGAIRKNLQRCVPGTLGILKRLAPTYELFLLSDHAKEWVAFVKEVHSFLSLFNGERYSFETGSLKNETITFILLLEAIGQEASTCLFIDDNAKNVATARTVGMKAIQFKDAQHLEEELAVKGILVSAQ